jgi:spermidine synthase
VHENANSPLTRSILAARVVLLLVGFTAVIGQVVLMRELIVLFNGNELSLGIMLATWLVWTAAGSWLAGRIVRTSRHPEVAVAVAECLCGLSLPAAVWALRSARVLLAAVPGETLGPVSMLLSTLACLSVFCALSGSLFVLTARLYAQWCEVPGPLATSHAYLLETTGSALGGVLTSILLLHLYGSFQIATLVGMVNLCVAASLLLGTQRRRVMATAVVGALIVIPMLAWVAPQWERSSQARLWKGFQVLGSKDSIYGKLTVIEAGGMRSIYDNGSIVANVPDAAAAEEAVHYALLEHPAPRRVLLIGGGLSGGIVEALKHPSLERLDYVELDPALIAMYERFFHTAYERAFADARVHVHYADGRLYLKTTAARFDVVMVDLPDPQTAQLNRFFTEEFFESARTHLAPGGLLALQLHASEDYISPQLAQFLRCIHRTMRSVFAQVVILPGNTVHFFAAMQKGVLTDDPQVLVERLKSRGLQTHYVREYFIPFRMMPDRMAQVQEQLQPVADTPMNQDFHPVAYYFGVVLWSAQFRTGYAHWLEAATYVHFAWVMACVAAVFLLLIALLRWRGNRRQRTRAAAVWAVCATGYTLMAVQLLILLAFQSVFGYVYGELSILIGMFMGGIALGTWIGITLFRHAGLERLRRAAVIDQLAMAMAGPLLLAAVYLMVRNSGMTSSAWVAHIAFPALAVLCAMPGGVLFPIATEIYLRERDAGRGTGTLYALDLVGGCAGALLLAGFLIPIFGFWNTAWIAAAVSLAPALLLVISNFDTNATAQSSCGAHQRQRQ